MIAFQDATDWPRPQYRNIWKCDCRVWVCLNNLFNQLKYMLLVILIYYRRRQYLYHFMSNRDTQSKIKYINFKDKMAVVLSAIRPQFLMFATEFFVIIFYFILQIISRIRSVSFWIFYLVSFFRYFFILLCSLLLSST